MNRLFGPIWTAPILLGLLTIIGLISALLGDGLWDALSALTLGIVAFVGARYSLRRPKVSQKSPARASVSKS